MTNSELLAQVRLLRVVAVQQGVSATKMAALEASAESAANEDASAAVSDQTEKRVELVRKQVLRGTFTIDARDFLALQLPPVQYFLSARLPGGKSVGLAQRHAVTLVAGMASGGKTKLLLNLIAERVVEEVRESGWVPAFIFEAEGGLPGLRGRVQAVLADRPEIAKGIFFIHRSPGFSLLAPTAVGELIDTMLRFGIDGRGIVFLDSLRRLIPGFDENDGPQMGGAIAALLRIREETGADAVVGVHHVNQGGYRPGATPDLTWVSGRTQAVSDADGVVLVVPDEEERQAPGALSFVAWNLKARDLEKPRPVRGQLVFGAQERLEWSPEEVVPARTRRGRRQELDDHGLENAISEALRAAAPKPLSKRAIYDAVKGTESRKREALERLARAPGSGVVEGVLGGYCYLTEAPTFPAPTVSKRLEMNFETAPPAANGALGSSAVSRLGNPAHTGFRDAETAPPAADGLGLSEAALGKVVSELDAEAEMADE